MISVAQQVESEINRRPLIKDLLVDNLLNMSAYARIIKPKVEEELMKDVSNGSIVMALKRLSIKLKKAKKQRIDYKKFFTNLTLKNRLYEVNYKNSSTLLVKVSSLMSKINLQEHFFSFSKGLLETTIILSEDLRWIEKDLLQDEEEVIRIESLSAISLKLSDNHKDTPGIIHYVIKLLAWQGINIVEIISTYSELTIVLKNEDTNKAFEILNDFLSS